MERIGQTLDHTVTREREGRPEIRLLRILLERRQEPVSIGWLAEEYGSRFTGGEAPEPRWVGFLIRERLGLRTEKRHGVFRLAEGQADVVRRLAVRFDLAESGDVGDIGDVARGSAS